MRAFTSAIAPEGGIRSLVAGTERLSPRAPILRTNAVFRGNPPTILATDTHIRDETEVA